MQVELIISEFLCLYSKDTIVKTLYRGYTAVSLCQLRLLPGAIHASQQGGLPQPSWEYPAHLSDPSLRSSFVSVWQTFSKLLKYQLCTGVVSSDVRGPGVKPYSLPLWREICGKNFCSDAQKVISLSIYIQLLELFIEKIFLRFAGQRNGLCTRAQQ